MYPEGGGEEAPAEAGGGGGGGGFSRVSYHLEGLIPLVLILVVGLVIGAKIGLFDIPFLSGQKPLRVLVVGTPLPGVEAIFDEDKDLVTTVTVPADRLEINPKEQLAQYDVVWLDQSYQEEKFLSRQAGEALADWVKKGGKLVLVMDSGVLRRGATDIVGWKASLGDIAPVECQRLKNNQPSCLQPVRVQAAEIQRADFDHPIMEGFDVAPARPEDPALSLTTFDVVSVGNTIAIVQDIESGDFYPGIVEKKTLLGKVIYFNYDPSLTRALLEATLEYLR